MDRNHVEDLADEIEARLRSAYPLPESPTRVDLVKLAEARNCYVGSLFGLDTLGVYLHGGGLGVIWVQAGLPDCVGKRVISHELSHHETRDHEDRPLVRRYTQNPSNWLETVARELEHRLCPLPPERPAFDIPAAPVWRLCELTHGYTLCADSRSEPWLHGPGTRWPKVLRTVRVRPWPVLEWREILLRYRDGCGTSVVGLCAASEAIRRWDEGSGFR